MDRDQDARLDRLEGARRVGRKVGAVEGRPVEGRAQVGAAQLDPLNILMGRAQVSQLIDLSMSRVD